MRILSSVIAASFVATVGLAAQQAPPTSSPAAPGGERQQPAPSAQASGQSKTVTLSGCIQNAPAASASASAAGASASASSAEQKFVLSTKPASGAAAGSAVGTSGTAMRYQLEGDTKAISPHLNHQVEITGTVDNSSASASGASAGAAGAGAPSGPMLKVESVKMVAATCS